MNGVSLHYYTCSGWEGPKGSATHFDTNQYYWALAKCLEIEEVIKKHKAIMDEADPENKIGLLVDEWGTWWDEEPGTIPGHLYQQNALRDAFVAALSLNVFHKYTDRVKMTNIAQVVNVLQSMILTDQEGTGHMCQQGLLQGEEKGIGRRLSSLPVTFCISCKDSRRLYRTRHH